jgi:AcrR family transcriptional regulator
MDIPIEAVKKLLKLLGRHVDAPADKTRDRIILSAKKRFLEEGFAKVPIGNLCHDLRISKKTFYKHFEDKEDLVRAIIAGNFKLFFPYLGQMLNDEIHPDDLLNTYVDFFFNMLAKNMAVPFLADLQALMPEIWDGIDEVRRFHVRRIIEIFVRGQKMGIYRQDLDPEVLSRVLVLIMSRVVDPRILYENHLRLQDVIGIFFPVLREGIYLRTDKEG